MKIPSPTELRLLALVYPRELPGREVARLYHRETGKRISYGTLYSTLRRLKEAGWIRTRDDQDQDGRVRYFRLTARGRSALADARQYYAEIAEFGLQLSGGTS